MGCKIYHWWHREGRRAVMKMSFQHEMRRRKYWLFYEDDEDFEGKFWSNFLKGDELGTSAPGRISILAGWASMLVVQSVQSRKSHGRCHFYPSGKIAFSTKVKDGLVTEVWLLLQSPWDDSTDPPDPLHASKPPTYTSQLRHSHKQVHTEPPHTPLSVHRRAKPIPTTNP